MSTSKSRKSHLTTYELARLDNACKVLESAWHWRTYLVGTAESGSEYRDVDVRTILEDREFDWLFMGRQQLWELLCLSLTAYLRDATGLPIDYQIQRMTEANEKFGDKPRNPLGTREGNRFAGGGDATHFDLPDEWFCGCCGNEAPEGLPWCERCEGHVRAGFPPWENTYEALTGEPCPFQVTNDLLPQQFPKEGD